MENRVFTLTRKTKETDITCKIDLDGVGISHIETGIPFFDHMLISFTRYARFDLDIIAKGDLSVDFHHTVEDVGLVLGKAILGALGEGRGIERFGWFLLPMDDALVRVALDISGRPYLSYNATYKEERVGEFSVSLVVEFLRAFSNEAKITLHIDVLKGENAHHIIEAIFKALGKALGISLSIKGDEIPSTKGLLV